MKGKYIPPSKFFKRQQDSSKNLIAENFEYVQEVVIEDKVPKVRGRLPRAIRKS